MTARCCGASAAPADWKPQNYDQQFHDKVQLRTALAHSYNVSTARLGIELGVERILDKLPLYGIERRPPPFASSLLGAYELSPIEVAQLYQTFADGGFRTPLRAHPRGRHRRRQAAAALPAERRAGRRRGARCIC